MPRFPELHCVTTWCGKSDSNGGVVVMDLLRLVWGAPCLLMVFVCWIQASCNHAKPKSIPNSVAGQNLQTHQMRWPPRLLLYFGCLAAMTLLSASLTPVVQVEPKQPPMYISLHCKYVNFCQNCACQSFAILNIHNTQNQHQHEASPAKKTRNAVNSPRPTYHFKFERWSWISTIMDPVFQHNISVTPLRAFLQHLKNESTRNAIRSSCNLMRRWSPHLRRHSLLGCCWHQNVPSKCCGSTLHGTHVAAQVENTSVASVCTCSIKVVDIRLRMWVWIWFELLCNPNLMNAVRCSLYLLRTDATSKQFKSDGCSM